MEQASEWWEMNEGNGLGGTVKRDKSEENERQRLIDIPILKL